MITVYFIFNQKDVYVLNLYGTIAKLYIYCIFSQLHALVQLYVLAAMSLKRKQQQLVTTS